MAPEVEEWTLLEKQGHLFLKLGEVHLCRGQNPETMERV